MFNWASMNKYTCAVMAPAPSADIIIRRVIPSLLFSSLRPLPWRWSSSDVLGSIHSAYLLVIYWSRTHPEWHQTLASWLKHGLVREELQIIPSDTELPTQYILILIFHKFRARTLLNFILNKSITHKSSLSIVSSSMTQPILYLQ